MLIAVLSDIHGNFPALEAVLADLCMKDLDGMIVAGDMVGGPQPNEVLSRLVEFSPYMIQGNNEQYMLCFSNGSAPPSWYTHKQWGFLRHSCNLLGKQWINLLSALPEQITLEFDKIKPMRVVHGSPRQVNELLYPDIQSPGLQQALVDTSEALLICGHTHKPWIFKHDSRLVVNPGAVTGGLNGDPRAQYALLHWEHGWEAELCAVPYDINLTIQAYEESGLLSEAGGFARGCIDSLKSGRNTSWEFVQFAYRLAEQAGIIDLQEIPDELWILAEEQFFWDQE